MTWQVVGTSVIGTSHVTSGKPCQDSHGFRILGEDLIFVVVADGLGSADHSEIGSHLAVDAALISLTDDFLAQPVPTDETSQACLEKAFAAARAVLEARAVADGIELRDLGTTLICVICTSEWVAIGQIGDGAVVARLSDGSMQTLSAPQRGEYANETIPLTTRDALNLVRYCLHKTQTRSMAVISDGLQNLALVNPDYHPFEAFFVPFFKIIQQPTDLVNVRLRLDNFLASERICGRTDDDKTLVLAGWCEEPVEIAPTDGDAIADDTGDPSS